MAITRIYQSGAETGSEDETSGDGGTSAAVDAVYANTGTYSFLTKGNSLNRGRFDIDFPATYQLRISCFHLYVASQTVTSKRSMYTLRNSAADVLASIYYNFSRGASIWINGDFQDTMFGWSKGAWTHIGIDIKLDPTNGWFNVYLEGALVMSYAGPTANDQISKWRFGKQEQVNYSNHQRWDDIFIDDLTGEGAPAIVPVRRFYSVAPNGAGNYTQWDPSAGANYECVDEVPPSVADYVETATVDEFDSYAMENFAIPNALQIDSVIPLVYAKRDDTTEEIAVGTRYSGTDLVGSDQIPAASEAFFRERQTTKPGGGAWDQTSIDAFEMLIKSRGSY